MLSFFMPLSKFPTIFLLISLKLARFPSGLLLIMYTQAHPTKCLHIHLLIVLPSCLFFMFHSHHLFRPLFLSLRLFVPQTAATVTWSCRRCVTSRRGWTSCRLRPSSPGRSSSLFIEASRTYVQPGCSEVFFFKVMFSNILLLLLS